jgi:hypothetical protein
LAANRQQRAKVLFIRHLDTGDVDDPRGQHRGVRIRLAQPFMGGVISLEAAQNMLAAQQKLEALGGKVLLRLRQPRYR